MNDDIASSFITTGILDRPPCSAFDQEEILEAAPPRGWCYSHNLRGRHFSLRQSAPFFLNVFRFLRSPAQKTKNRLWTVPERSPQAINRIRAVTAASLR